MVCLVLYMLCLALLGTTSAQLQPKIKPSPKTKGKPKNRGGEEESGETEPLCNADTVGSPCGDGEWSYGLKSGTVFLIKGVFAF